MIHFDEKKKRWRVVIDRRLSGTRYRVRKLLAKGTSEEEAQRISDSMESQAVERALAVNGADEWGEYVDSMLATKRSWIYQTLARCKGMRGRGKIGGCAITADMIANVLRRSKGRCEVSGITFSHDTYGTNNVRPFFHSLDRIDSAKGYLPDNIRVVCVAVNIAMSSWGEQVFADIAVGYVLNKYVARSGFTPLQNLVGISPTFSGKKPEKCEEVLTAKAA